MEAGKKDKDIVALCSDSRGSASFTGFANELPEQFVETGIAEQNLVLTAAGMAMAGMKPVAYSMSSFLAPERLNRSK